MVTNRRSIPTGGIGRTEGAAVGRIGFKGLAFFLGAGVIFGAGWLAGGSLGTGQVAKEQRVQIERCLPIGSVAALDDCLAGESN